jgi:hypothetical protein
MSEQALGRDVVDTVIEDGPNRGKNGNGLISVASSKST